MRPLAGTTMYSVWVLANSWQRPDPSVTQTYTDRQQSPLRQRLRILRGGWSRHPVGSDEDPLVGDLIIERLRPVVTRHGIMVDPQNQGHSVVWCSSPDDITIAGAEPCDDPHECIDLWVHAHPEERVIVCTLDSEDLHRFVAGGTMFDVRESVALSDDLPTSLDRVAGELDRLCERIVQRPAPASDG